MFKSILAAWDKFFAWVAWAWQEGWRAVNALFGKVWAVVLMLIAALVQVWEWVTQSITQVIGIFDQVVFPSITTAAAPGDVLAVMSTANTFLPLQELFSFLVAYMALYAAVMTYRLIKSWIPGLNG